LNTKTVTETPPARTQSTPPLLFPFLDLKAQFESIRHEILAAVERTFESQGFILGPEVAKLESEIAELTACKYAVGCASGSDALLLALMALEIGTGDEVITVPFTFGATAGSIARTGARPVFVDIDPVTYNIDPALMERAITPKTRALMPVHLFGAPAEMKPIREIAAKRKLAIVEDAAQAIGSRYQGEPTGSLGDVGCFSFFPSKNLGGAGDGGMITTNDPELADRLKVLRVHGTRSKYTYERVGVNSRLDALQAAVLRVKLRKLRQWTTQRQENAARYATMFTNAGLDKMVTLPETSSDDSHVYNQYTVRTPERDSLRSFLRSAGIPTEIYYPFPLHLQRAYEYLGYGADDFPHSSRACKEVLALPIYPELTETQQQAVVDSIADFFSRFTSSNSTENFQ